MKDVLDDNPNPRQAGCGPILLFSAVFFLVTHSALIYWPNRDDAALTVIRKAAEGSIISETLACTPCPR